MDRTLFLAFLLLPSPPVSTLHITPFHRLRHPFRTASPPPSRYPDIPRPYRINDEDDPKDPAATTAAKNFKSLSEFLKNRTKIVDVDDVIKDDGNRYFSLPLELEANIPFEVNGLKDDVKDIKTNKVSNVHELRNAILKDKLELKQIELVSPPAPAPSSLSSEYHEPFNHEVLSLIKHRIETKSKPKSRSKDDTAILALAIEGGGMRGAVSAGMASAIASLGLCDAFDSIYGSSAGSVVGAYMVSRQMCMDVYTEILPKAKSTFVSKLRIMSELVMTLITNHPLKIDIPRDTTPGMNISFVLDGILCPEGGLRPLDVDAFRKNDQKQPLKVVSSVVRDETLETVCFSSADGDFFDSIDKLTNQTILATTCKDRHRHGLFACLEASMTVPGATGPPVNLVRRKNQENNTTSASFDAFCFEPLPYRSAVEEGATHVLVLRSRPEQCEVKTKPGVYEKAVAKLYFQSHGQPKVAEYFERGGQQYRYLEDVLTLDEGRYGSDYYSNAMDDVDAETFDGVLVPPSEILYGHGNDPAEDVDYNTWKRAHLLPIVVPKEKPELPTLAQDEDEVLDAVRHGFAAAFDALAPVSGIELDHNLTGDRVAELMFPRMNTTGTLDTQVRIIGDLIETTPTEQQHTPKSKMSRVRGWLRRRKLNPLRLRSKETPKITDALSSNEYSEVLDDSLFVVGGQLKDPSLRDARTLLACLPGIQSGKLSHLAQGLRYINENS